MTHIFIVNCEYLEPILCPLEKERCQIGSFGQNAMLTSCKTYTNENEMEMYKFYLLVCIYLSSWNILSAVSATIDRREMYLYISGMCKTMLWNGVPKNPLTVKRLGSLKTSKAIATKTSADV